MLYYCDLNLFRGSKIKIVASVWGEKKIFGKVMELLRLLGYNLVTIPVADSTGLADENVLGFALGEKLRSRSS